MEAAASASGWAPPGPPDDPFHVKATQEGIRQARARLESRPGGRQALLEVPACWSQPLAGRSIASSAAPKRATTWAQHTEEEE